MTSRGIRIRRGQRELHGFFHFRLELGLHLLQRRRIGHAFLEQPSRSSPIGIALGLPLLLFLLGAIIFAADVANVMARDSDTCWPTANAGPSPRRARSTSFAVTA